jgi:hypothetical protein
MNERIQDLIKQMDKAGLPYGNNAMTITDVDLEYFAKLIIQECAQVGFDYADGHCCEISAVILEHFGVQE